MEIHDVIPVVEELERSDYDYFTGVLPRIREQFEDEEDKEIFYKNVFNSMIGHELQLVCHRKLSHEIEEMLSLASEEQLVSFMDKLKENFLLISKHTNGSHVVQSILELCLKHSSASTNDEENKDHDKLVQAVVGFGKLVCEDLAGFLKTSPSCHVVCTLLEVLSGYTVSDRILRSKKSQRLEKKDRVFYKKKGSIPVEKIEVPEKFSEILMEIAECLIKFPDFNSIVAEPCSSMLLQTALLVLSKYDGQTAHRLVDTLIPTLFPDDTDAMNSLFNCNITPLIEKVLETASPEQYSLIWENNVKANLREIVIHPVANFVAQTLFRSCPSKKELEEMFEQLESSWSKVAETGYLGILVSFSSACARLVCCQAKFVQLLTELLQCTEKKESLAPLVLEWPISKSSNTKHSCKVNYHGSLLIQNLLRFQKPAIVTDSLLKMDPTELQVIFCGAYSSHVLDAYVESPTVGDKKRKLLAEKLKGQFVNLACNQHGSRCIEKLWEAMDLKEKTIIVEELAEKELQLRNDKFGTIVSNSFGVALFKKRSKDWQEWQTKGMKKQKMFNDILQSSDDPIKPKKKKQRFR